MHNLGSWKQDKLAEPSGISVAIFGVHGNKWSYRDQVLAGPQIGHFPRTPKYTVWGWWKHVNLAGTIVLPVVSLIGSE